MTLYLTEAERERAAEFGLSPDEARVARGFGMTYERYAAARKEMGDEHDTPSPKELRARQVELLRQSVSGTDEQRAHIVAAADELEAAPLEESG